ncbi:MAG: UDP-glucose--hexose-1-phosphate uridylyltransferase [Sphaerochaetaceae bacterium]|nr:UDP-glucose--hexose-1-phosphate uridylyltransferase [Sphaerochaetaceae bacterium]MDC7238399.1 UDP-glucose--hexose-1-phosphate uridylyltransferase [Sphaerochaetaceae bacterium]MDC7250164.1 UDP-glucose--hexose-1-phosphate uridylyltransferase [Sphaerochaetaceae bacterium]
MEKLQESTHNRLNPLTGEWIKVSPHRTKRPWQGQVEDVQRPSEIKYDSSCYLCPTNTRSNNEQNPDYKDTFVFTNDFSALLSDTDSVSTQFGPNNLLKSKGEKGVCKVICFSPRHDLTVARMEVEDIVKIIKVWREQYNELGKLSYINHVQIFENKGSIMGCSNPHPHGQIWAEEIIPNLPKVELKKQKEYYEENNSSMLLDYAQYELKEQSRVVYSNDDFIVVVPYWATWPYETMILPLNKSFTNLNDLTSENDLNLAKAINILTIKYDNLFKTNFPYSMGLHQKPTNNENYLGNIMHFHYYPPLLRSASVKKFMVGYELLAMAQRDITAEMAAKQLRELDNTHYLKSL